VEIEGRFDEGGSWERWEDDEVELSTEERVKECFCFACGEVDEEDLVTDLKRCGVEEVRTALAKGRFDLDAFDPSPRFFVLSFASND